jgi:hypothetical protein
MFPAPVSLPKDPMTIETMEEIFAPSIELSFSIFQVLVFSCARGEALAAQSQYSALDDW